MRYWRLLSLAALCGCASITDGTDQTIIVQVQPRDARCSVMRDDVELGTVTGTYSSIRVSKGAKDILVNCAAPGHVPKVSRLVSTTQAAGMMSVLFLDFGITDMVTGAMWKYPSSINVFLDRDQGGPPVQPGAPAPPVGVQAAAVPVIMPVPAEEKPKPPPVKDVKDAFVAERFAKDAGCADVRATFVGRGPGYESYSFQCTNGETLIVRCEYGACRELK